MPIKIKGYSLKRRKRLIQEKYICGFEYFSGFNCDLIRQDLVSRLVRFFSPNCFVETGTYMGDTTGYIAERFPNLEVYSCEINEAYARDASEKLKRFRNVIVLNCSSERGLQALIQDHSCRKRYFFYLDAHWNDYWPLQDEISIITNSRCEAILMIDDFKVPGKGAFEFDVGGGGSSSFSGRTTLDLRHNDFQLIKPCMASNNAYKIFYPNYSYKEAFGRLYGQPFRGYVVIFQNVDLAKIERFKGGRFARQNLLESSDSLK